MSNTEPKVIFYNRVRVVTAGSEDESLVRGTGDGLFRSSRAYGNGRITTGAPNNNLYATPASGTAQGRYFDVNLNAFQGNLNRLFFMGFHDATVTSVSEANDNTFTVFRNNRARPNGYLSFTLNVAYIGNSEGFISSITNDYTINLTMSIIRGIPTGTRTYSNGDSYTPAITNAVNGVRPDGARVLETQLVIDLSPSDIPATTNSTPIPVVINLASTDTDITGNSFDADIVEYSISITSSSGTIPTTERLVLWLSPRNDVISVEAGATTERITLNLFFRNNFLARERLLRFEVTGRPTEFFANIGGQAYTRNILTTVTSDFGVVIMHYDETIDNTRLVIFSRVVDPDPFTGDPFTAIVMVFILGRSDIGSPAVTCQEVLAPTDTAEAFEEIRRLSRYPYDYDGWERQSITTTEAIFSKNIYKTYHQDFVQSTLKFQSMDREDARVAIAMQRLSNFYISFTGLTTTIQNDEPFSNVNLHRVTITKKINPKITSNIFGNGYDFNMEIQTSG